MKLTTNLYVAVVMILSLNSGCTKKASEGLGDLSSITPVTSPIPAPAPSEGQNPNVMDINALDSKDFGDSSTFGQLKLNSQEEQDQIVGQIASKITVFSKGGSDDDDDKNSGKGNSKDDKDKDDDDRDWDKNYGKGKDDDDEHKKRCRKFYSRHGRKYKNCQEPTFTSIKINIKEVSAYNEAVGWVLLNGTPQIVDLIQVSANANVILVDRRIPPGTYKQLRLKIEGNASGKLDNGKSVTIKVPAGERSGIKLKHQFTIEKGLITLISLNFDPERSIKELGNSGKYIMSPYIRINGIEEDLTIPAIAILSPTQRYSKNLVQAIEVEYADANLNLSSLSIKVNGVEVKNSFVIDQVSAKGSLTFVEGEHTITSSISDLAPNLGTANPVTITIDKTAPIINLVQSYILTKTPTVSISADLFDSLSGIDSNSFKLFIDEVLQPGIPMVVGTRYTSTADTSEGDHSYLIEISDRAGNKTVVSGSLRIDLTPPNLSLNSPSNASIVYTNTLPIDIPIKASSSEPLISAIINGFASAIEPSGLNFQKNITASFAGQLPIDIKALDYAGNEGVLTNSVSVVFDNTAPSIQLGVADNFRTKDYSLNLPIQISDSSPALTRITVNGTEVLGTYAKDFVYNINLTLEGENQIQVVSIDEAGNSSLVNSLKIVRDTKGPQLTFTSPASGSVVNGIAVDVRISSNENLTNLVVNSYPATISGNSGQVTISIPAPGEVEIKAVGSDDLGNTTEASINVFSVINALNPTLISAFIDTEINKIRIRGAVGAVRPGLTLKVSTGFFTSTNISPSADGSFYAEMGSAPVVKFSVFDPEKDQTFSSQIDLASKIETIFSGQVRSTEDVPLAGVKVTIIGTTLTTTTDENGVFLFSKSQYPDAMVFGDRKIEFDGTPVVARPDQSPRIYSKSIVPVSIGLAQTNVLQTPIYLGFTRIDDGTEITTAAGGIVADATNAPGFEIRIPANSAQFPDGMNQVLVSMEKIPGRFTSVPPPETSVPKYVISLEPTGAKFSEPVELTMPNPNEFPAGTDLVIMSLNSESGQWEVGGIAQVSPDGNSIKTKPNMGIRHFSPHYATLPGAVILPVGDNDSPGVNVLKGTQAKTINLPSFKILGQEASLTLQYNSSWAKPSAVVTNLLDFGKQQLVADFNVSGNGSGYSLTRRHCANENGVLNCYDSAVGLLDSQNYTTYFTDVTSEIQPEVVETFFETATVRTPNYKFENIPQWANLPVFTELKDTNGYLKTGSYPYRSHTEIKFKELIIGTATTKAWSATQDVKFVTETKSEVRSESERVTTQDLNGNLFVQNHRESSAGKGWRIGGVQKIVNPTADKIMIEEADGSVANYSISNTIESVFRGSDWNGNLTNGVDIARFPKIGYRSGNDYYEIDASAQSPSPRLLSTEVPMTGRFTAYTTYNFNRNGSPFFPTSYCLGGEVAYSYHASSNQFMVADDGSTVVADGGRHLVTQRYGTGSYSNLAGEINYFEPPVQLTNNYFVASDTLQTDIDSVCSSYKGLECIKPYALNPLYFNPGYFRCFPLPFIPHVNRPFPLAGNSQRQLNNPYGISKGRAPGTFVVADYGNNSVKLVSSSFGGFTQTIAGSGSFADQGDGLPATQASLNHPSQAIYDSQGNLYITSDTKLWVVDTGGIIHHIAGTAEGILADESDAKEAKFDGLQGLAIDEDQRVVYVSDTRHHRVVRIDLDRSRATTIAGNGIAGFSGDGKSALDSQLFYPSILSLDENGNLLIFDSGNNRVRRVNFTARTNGIVSYSPANKDLSKLVRSASGFERTYRNGDIAKFNTEGFQISLEDRVGNKSQFTYDSDKNLTTAETADHQIVSYGYSGGLLASITDPAGRTTNFGHDSDGNLTYVAYPDGGTVTYAYDPQGLMISETNERGKITKTSYNQFDRVKTIEFPDQSIITVQDLDSLNLAGIDFNVPSQPNAPSGAFMSVKDALGNSSKIMPNRYGMPRGILDAANRKSEIVADSDGRISKIVRSDNSFIQISYDQQTDDVVSILDSRIGSPRSTTYNSFGQKVTETDVLGKTTTKNYDPNSGLILSAIGPDGTRVDLAYGSYGLPVSRTLQNNGTSLTSQMIRDSLGRVIKEILPDGKEVTMSYDAAGNVVSVTNRLDATRTATTQYFYSARNRLEKVISAKGETTIYSHLPTGELSSITDANGKITTFEYDDRGRLIRRTSPNGEIYQTSYDGNNNVISETDPRGIVKSMVYNNVNALIRVQTPDDLTSITYDDQGRVQSAFNNVSSVSYEYNLQNFVSKVSVGGRGTLSDFPSFDIVYQVGPTGKILGSTTPYGTRSNTFDSDGKLVGIATSNGLGGFGYEYDQIQRLAKINRPGSFSNFTYNQGGLLAAIQHYSGTNLRDFTELEYDHRNIPNKKRNISGAFNMAHDENGQLISHDTVLGSETWSYDGVGNRVTATGPGSGLPSGATTSSYQFDDSKQRLIDDGNYVYGFDASGNVIFKNPKRPELKYHSFSYNSKNQLTRVQLLDFMGGPVISQTDYAYDVLGRRIQKTVVNSSNNSLGSSYTRRYLLEGEEVFAEVDGAANNALLAEYLHSKIAIDDVLSVRYTPAAVAAGITASSGTFYYLKDHLGSITDIVDGSGEIVQHYEYSAFGKILRISDRAGSDISANPIIKSLFSFTARELEVESGLIFFRARYYDPEIGRFLQVDPFPGVASDPLSVTQKYAYARNAPSLLTDPSGLSWLSDATGINIDIGGAISGAVNGIGIGLHDLVENLGAGFDRLVKSEGFKKLVIFVAAVVVAFYLGPALVTLGVNESVASALATLASGVFAGASYNAAGVGTFEEGFQVGLIAGAFGVGMAHAAGRFDAAAVNIDSSTKGYLVAQNSTQTSVIVDVIPRSNWLIKSGNFLIKAGSWTVGVGAGFSILTGNPGGLAVAGVGVFAIAVGFGLLYLEPFVYGAATL